MSNATSFASTYTSKKKSEDLSKEVMPNQTGTSFISVDDSRDMVVDSNSSSYVDISNTRVGTRGILSCVFGECAGGQNNSAQSPTYELNTPPGSPFGCITRELESGWPESRGRPIDLTSITEESRSCDVDLTGSNSTNGESLDTAIFSTDGKFDTYGRGRQDKDELLANTISTSSSSNSSSYSDLEKATKRHISGLNNARERVPGKVIPTKKKGFFCCKKDVEDQVVQ